MKTIFEIEGLIKTNMKTGELMRLNKGYEDTAAYKKLQKETAKLRKVRLYLEHDPREELLREQLDACTKQIEDIDNGFAEWKSRYYRQEVFGPNPKSAYLSETERSRYVNQQKGLQFILGLSDKL